MPFKPRRNFLVDFSDLKGTLLGSNIQNKDPNLYRTIAGLIEKSQQSSVEVNTTLQSFFGRVIITDDVDLSAILTTIGNINDILKFVTFITELDETTQLPKSRMVIGGTNITLDVSVPGQIIINASGASSNLNDYLTWSNESIDLPNSRQLLPGTGIIFDDTVANQRTISATEGIHPFLLMGG